MLLIDSEDLHVALQTAKPLFNELQGHYENLPPTQCCCETPGVCCTYIPQMTLMEALQWVHIIQQQAPLQRANTIKTFMAFYLTNPVRHSGCPFRRENACGIYQFRPFACRAYGLWSRKIGDNRTELNRIERQNVLARWKKLGLDLPPEMVEFEIDYCEQVECSSRQADSDNQLMAILEKIYQLDQNLPEQRKIFEEAYHSDFSFWMTSLVLGIRKSILIKFAVIKEMVNQGSSKRLQDMLDKVTPRVRDSP